MTPRGAAAGFSPCPAPAFVENPIRVTEPAAHRPSPFPPGLANAYWFAAFNALSFQIILGGPMVLYAKSIGASATVLGLLTGMMPLLVILQIPAANHVSRVGYRQFVYAGWGIRVLFIFAMTLVPLTAGFLDAATRLVLILALLFGFNFSRGISSAGWLPWIASLVPAHVRGHYLARDAAVVNLACGASCLLAAGGLGSNPAPWRFTLLFGFSAIMGAISLFFLKRIPEGTPPEAERRSTTPVPWLSLLGFRPFQKLLIMVLPWAAAYGGAQAFTVVYLKAAGLEEGRILLITSVFFLGGLSSLWLLGARLDRIGSKPVLTASFAAWALVMTGWAVVAGRGLADRLALVLALQFLMGLLAAMVGMANSRLLMAIAPVMGRNHFFALFSVAANVTQGLAPVAWGVLLDAVGTRHFPGPGLEWNNFSLFFTALAAVFLTALALARKLQEESMS